MNLDWFLPKTSSERDLTKAKILSYTSLTLSVMTLLLCPTAYYFTNSDFPFLSISIALFLMALLFKKTGSINLVGNMLCGITYLAFMSLIPKTGGIFSEDLHSIFIVPLASFVLVGFKSGIIWSAISFATIVYYHSQVGDAVDVAFLRNQQEHLNSNYYLAISCINIVIACVLSYILIKENNKLLEKIEGQKSELLEANSKLLKTEAKLKHRNNELNKFTSVVSHDLQQPVRTIQNFSGFVKEHLEETEDPESPQLTYIKFIEEGTIRMRRLITDLLDYARSTNKQDEFHHTALDDILNEVVIDLNDQISSKDVQFKRKPLPKLNVIPVRMYQIFQNLISNAIKFKKKEEPLVVEIYSIDKENETIIAIKDNGIGIKEKFQKEIFEPFKKLHSKQEYEGSGIGLSTCLNIVNMHNGSLWVESEFGVGTTIFFSIAKDLEAKPKTTGQRKRAAKY